MEIDTTREIINAILDGSVEDAPLSTPDPHFQLRFPTRLPGIDSAVLDPSQAWEDHEAYEAACRTLSRKYKDNFVKFEADPFLAELGVHGPGGSALLA